MHFCLTGQYTAQALNAIMDNPNVSRYEAAKNLIEAAGGKLISMYPRRTADAIRPPEVPSPDLATGVRGPRPPRIRF